MIKKLLTYGNLISANMIAIDANPRLFFAATRGIKINPIYAIILNNTSNQSEYIIDLGYDLIARYAFLIGFKENTSLKN